ncbi:chloride channel protein [Arcanobacterium phocisimile]|nr:chloride channel protein [Arcanobacterium phocisimile]
MIKPRLLAAPESLPDSMKSFMKILGSHRSTLAIVAAVIGAVVGLASVVFHYCIEGWTYLMTGYSDYSAHPGASHGLAGWGSWFIALTPVISGFLYGPMITKWAPSARGHGIPEVMLAVKRKGGKIPGAVAVVKIIASALTLGGGGSVGREGPIVQVGAALGSSIANKLHLTTRQVVLFVGCGSAAGIAATFNAPLAGAVFALELILINFTAETFGMCVIAAVASSLVGHAFLEDVPVVAIPYVLRVGNSIDFILIILVGFIAALAGLGFSKILYAVEDLIDAIYHLPEWARPGIGGIAIGIMLFFLPEMYGSGYPIQLDALEGKYAIGFLLLLALMRAIFTATTIGIGGSGGVFAPTLFIGAMVGSAFGQAIAPLTSTSASVFGVIGMGAAFAGAARAPMTGVLIIIEMTGQYSLIMPMMLAVVVATATSRFLTRKTIYTTKLIRRGDILDDPVDHTLVGRVPAAKLMTPVPATVTTSATIREANHVLVRTRGTRIPVTDDDGKYVGCFTALIWAHVSTEGISPDTPLSAIDLDHTHITPEMLPTQVLSSLIDNNASAVVVVNDDETIAGWVTQRDLVRLIHKQQRAALSTIENESSFGSRWLMKHPDGLRPRRIQRTRRQDRKEN